MARDSFDFGTIITWGLVIGGGYFLYNALASKATPVVVAPSTGMPPIVPVSGIAVTTGAGDNPQINTPQPLTSIPIGTFTSGGAGAGLQGYRRRR